MSGEHKMNYLFLSPNNGHYETYTPITIDRVISQDKVNELLRTIPGVGRVGANLGCFLEICHANRIKAEIYKCKCCHQEIAQIDKDNPYFADWEILEGISGNY